MRRLPVLVGALHRQRAHDDAASGPPRILWAWDCAPGTPQPPRLPHTGAQRQAPGRGWAVTAQVGSGWHAYAGVGRRGWSKHSVGRPAYCRGQAAMQQIAMIQHTL